MPNRSTSKASASIAFTESECRLLDRLIPDKKNDRSVNKSLSPYWPKGHKFGNPYRHDEPDFGQHAHDRKRLPNTLPSPETLTMATEIVGRRSRFSPNFSNFSKKCRELHHSDLRITCTKTQGIQIAAKMNHYNIDRYWLPPTR